jgi:hypothetical protein
LRHLEARSGSSGTHDAHYGFGGDVMAGCVGDIGDVTDSEARVRRTVNVWATETLQHVVDVGG